MKMRLRELGSLTAVSLLSGAIVLGSGCSGRKGDETLSSPLVSGLTVSEVAIFQGLKSSVMKDGAATTSPNVPIIAGRPGLLRIYVTPSASYVPHEVVVRVDLTQNGAAIDALEQRVTVGAASSEMDLSSTVNFDLPAATLTPDLTYAVSIHETKSGDAGPDTAGAQYPAMGQVALGAVTSGIVKITVLPVVYGADGSNRTPPMDDAYLQTFRDRMMALYPVTDVQITVGASFNWSQPVSADGTGWDELLDGVMRQRMRDGAPDDVYYYGLFAPDASFSKYCGQGCVTGLSTLAQRPTDNWARQSIGLSYQGSQADAPGTFVHEVGHAHGRQHAPCDTQDADRKFPYTDGQIGVYGYDAVAKTMLDPKGKVRDMMGYCDPIWISDYTYKALFDRIRALATSADRTLVPQSWRSILVNANGAKRTGTFTVGQQPGGEDKVVERVVGGRTEQVNARFFPFDHLPGGILLVPEGEDVGALRVDGKLVK